MTLPCRDWQQRPLPERCLRYAADDTCFLLPVAQRMGALSSPLALLLSQAWACTEYVREGRLKMPAGSELILAPVRHLGSKQELRRASASGAPGAQVQAPSLSFLEEVQLPASSMLLDGKQDGLSPLDLLASWCEPEVGWARRGSFLQLDRWLAWCCMACMHV